MHEGGHGILDELHDHSHDKKPLLPRIVAAIVTAGLVGGFLVWRFLL